MKIEEVVWLEAIVEKLAVKHRVTPYEVEAVLFDQPKIRFRQKGNRIGEDVYFAFGRTDAGRYLTVLFISKPAAQVLVISARDMTKKERRLYERK